MAYYLQQYFNFIIIWEFMHAYKIWWWIESVLKRLLNNTHITTYFVHFYNKINYIILTQIVREISIHKNISIYEARTGKLSNYNMTAPGDKMIENKQQDITL